MPNKRELLGKYGVKIQGTDCQVREMLLEAETISKSRPAK
jgi:hypothetical protein